MSLILDGTNGLSDVDGSASTPAIRGTDTNTGIFFPAADTIAFAEGGAEVARFDSSGNLGIGTNSPAFPLDVAGAMRSNSWIGRANTSVPTADAAIFRPANNTLGFSTANTERMRISSAGDLYVTNGSETIPSTAPNDVIAGGLIINPNRRTSSGSANVVWATPNGDFYRATSSIKYKKNVEDATYGLAEVMQLRSVTYQGKSEIDGEKQFGGFIAEEVDAIGLTEFVVYDEENKPDSLGYDRMVSLLTKAIQEQQAIITDLKARLEVLEAK